MRRTALGMQAAQQPARPVPPSEPAGVCAVRHAGLVVRSIERALRFYRDQLGLRVVWDRIESGPELERSTGLPGILVRTVKLLPPAAPSQGATQVELLEFLAPPVAADAAPVALHAPGLTHLALTVADLPDLYQRLRQAGVTFMAPPQPSADGRVRLAFCLDPDGVALELVEPLPENQP